MRWRLEVGEPMLTDSVGTVLAVSDTSVSVLTRRGRVDIETSRVVAAKPLPAAPHRRGAAHLALSVGVLQELMVTGMPPLDSQWQGRWLLRASAGYTGRANSVLPLGSSDLPDPLPHVTSWYADRGLPPLVQLFGPSGFDPAVDDSLGALLVARGWRVFQRTLVMTAPVPLSQRPPSVAVLETSDERWWAASSPREVQHRRVATRINDLVPASAFPLALERERPTGVARLAFAHGWMGVFSVHVPPDQRRGGIGRSLMQAAFAEAADRGVSLSYLQVSADNVAAVRLYESLGYARHHEYYYLRPTDQLR
nr:GNAT family N-acetyltransferase [Branchiibius hedensis]